MASVDRRTLENISQTLESDPSLFEKDFYAVQLLKTVSKLDSPHYDVVFAGGTAVSKVHLNTGRMSEDIDLKLFPKAETKALSRTAQRKARKAFHIQLIDAIGASDTLRIARKTTTDEQGNRVETDELEVRLRNERKYMSLAVEYPRTVEPIAALHPVLKLEVVEVEKTPLQPAINAKVSSIVAEMTQQTPEVASIPTVSLATTATEKVVALSSGELLMQNATPVSVRTIQDCSAMPMIFIRPKKREWILKRWRLCWVALSNAIEQNSADSIASSTRIQRENCSLVCKHSSTILNIKTAMTSFWDRWSTDKTRLRGMKSQRISVTLAKPYCLQKKPLILTNEKPMTFASSANGNYLSAILMTIRS